RPKSAQRHEVLADALKLTWIATTVCPRPRLILCLSDPRAQSRISESLSPLPTCRPTSATTCFRHSAANTDNYGQLMPGLERPRARLRPGGPIAWEAIFAADPVPEAGLHRQAADLRGLLDT